MTDFLPVFIITAIAFVIILTELIKKFDHKDRLKGYRVWIPVVLSGGIAWLLRLGDFFQPPQVWFWWAVIFAFSTFAYEAVLKKITTALGDNGVPF